MMKLAFPAVEWTMHKGDGYATIHSGTGEDSEIWFGGLDDSERVEKILGKEFSTLYFNESSHIPISSVDVAVTRLAQKAMMRIEGRDPTPLKVRALFDCNPPSKAHWTYKRFVLKVDPETGEPLSNPDDYASFQINPNDNAQNLSADYLDTLKGMSQRLQKRFLRGEFSDATPNQLFAEETIEKWRHGTDQELPDFVRVVVAVDPSGSGDVDNADNDAIGIVVVALGTDGRAYVLEDCTVKAGPATWGAIVASAYDRHMGDVVVGEGIVGTTTNNNANAGSFGEYQQQSATGTALTTGVNANSTSISLTAGDWDVEVDNKFNIGTGATVTSAGTTVTLTSAGAATLGQTTFNSGISATNSIGVVYVASPVVRFSLSATTTVYATGIAVFSGGTVTVDGLIRARRVR
ncbi:phage terminase large subunit [Paraburkholderia sp. A1RI-2L]|uniref:phage terminase large subunit n=1 Tax=Paraburkholderia sp. A1RI-2L TaxID=3028367 RepID=UPI003B7BF111